MHQKVKLKGVSHQVSFTLACQTHRRKVEVELTRVCVGSGVCHGEHPGACVLEDEVLVSECTARCADVMRVIVWLVERALATRSIVILQDREQPLHH